MVLSVALDWFEHINGQKSLLAIYFKSVLERGCTVGDIPGVYDLTESDNS